jgi:hypothetical protein
MVNVIFLDIDGVLNTPSYAVQAHAMWKRTKGWFKSRDKYGQVFDPMACACLEYLVDTTGAKVVISSTWRKSGLQVMKNMFIDRGIGITVIDITPETELIRGLEIEKWLYENPVANYVILDDNNDFTQYQLENHFVDCSGKFGFDHNAMVKALKILLTRS